MTGRSSLLMCTIRLPTSLRSRCASREYGVTPFALRSAVGDGGFAPEAIPTGWVSEGMTELRRQGFFRWGWTQESAVVAALFDIEWFDEDTPLDTVEGRHASQGKLLGQLTLRDATPSSIETYLTQFEDHRAKAGVVLCPTVGGDDLADLFNVHLVVGIALERTLVKVGELCVA